MRKSFITLAVTAALVISNITPAFAAYIVAPNPEESGTYAGYVWYMEELQRQRDRLINTYAENIKATTPENSVERLNAVVKAVADYCPAITEERIGDEQQWGTDVYNYTLISNYVYQLGKAVNLEVGGFGVTKNMSGYSLNQCTINGVVYYADAFRYVETSGAEGLASTNIGSYYKTDEQIEAERLSHPAVESITTANGQTFYLED